MPARKSEKPAKPRKAAALPSPRRASQRESGMRRAQSDATRAKILEAALAIFAERGFDGTSTRDIARAAGVNHAMLGYHFDNKDSLWRDAVRLLFARQDQELGLDQEEFTNLGSVDGYKEFIRRYVRYCARHPEHARIMVQESIRGSDRLTWAVNEFIRRGHENLSPPAERLIARGALPDTDRVSLTYAVVAMCQTPFMLAAELREIYGVDMTSDAAVEAHADAVIAILMAQRGVKKTA